MSDRFEAVGAMMARFRAIDWWLMLCLWASVEGHFGAALAAFVMAALCCAFRGNKKDAAGKDGQ